MNRKDLRILCTALGFTAIVLKEGSSKDMAARATALARQMESFCIYSVPDAIDQDSDADIFPVSENPQHTLPV